MSQKLRGCECGAFMRKVIETEKFLYGTMDPVWISVDIPVWKCDKCGFAYCDGEAEILREKAVRKHLGTMETEMNTKTEVQEIKQAVEEANATLKSMAMTIDLLCRQQEELMAKCNAMESDADAELDEDDEANKIATIQATITHTKTCQVAPIDFGLTKWPEEGVVEFIKGCLKDDASYWTIDDFIGDDEEKTVEVCAKGK